jgi:toxin FitB
VSFLLDTNVISELRKGKRANAAVLAWVNQVDDSELYLSALVIGELRQGIERLRRRDPTAAQGLERWLTRLVMDYADRIIPIDTAVAELWGRLNVPDPLPAIDGLLAATAIVRGYTLVTRNTSDVESTGVELLNPFQAGP